MKIVVEHLHHNIRYNGGFFSIQTKKVYGANGMNQFLFYCLQTIQTPEIRNDSSTNQQNVLFHYNFKNLF